MKRGEVACCLLVRRDLLVDATLLSDVKKFLASRAMVAFADRQVGATGFTMRRSMKANRARGLIRVWSASWTWTWT